MLRITYDGFLYVLLSGETNLSGKFDIVRIDLHPSEQYKSVRLIFYHLLLLKFVSTVVYF